MGVEADLQVRLMVLSATGSIRRSEGERIEEIEKYTARTTGIPAERRARRRSRDRWIERGTDRAIIATSPTHATRPGRANDPHHDRRRRGDRTGRGAGPPR